MMVQIATWIGWGLLMVFTFAIVYYLFYLLSHPYKLTIWSVYGSGTDGVFSIAKSRKNRARFNKDRTEWVLMWPLFKKKIISPFDSEYIYPGKVCYGFDLNGMIMPGRVNIKQEENEIRGEVNPVPNHVRHWQSLQHKKNAIEYAEKNWWEDNKALVYGVITVFICCALAAATIYFTYQFVGPRLDGGIKAAGEVADALNNLGVIPGK